VGIADARPLDRGKNNAVGSSACACASGVDREAGIVGRGAWRTIGATTLESVEIRVRWLLGL
jgi:hypothetical protein